MKASPPSRPPWPPVIDSSSVPLLIRLRDIVVTLVAWVVLAALLWRLVYFLWDYFSHPIFELSRNHSMDWLALWERIAVFILLGLVLIIWIALVGIARRKDLRCNWDPRKVPMLSLGEQAADFGISPEMVAQWREHRIVVVECDAANRIESVTARLPKPPTEEESS